MSSISPQEIKQEFLKSKMGIAGIIILSILIATSIIAIITIPVETFQEWNNPGSWISYPKVAIPIWVNYFMTEKIPEHKIYDTPNIQTNSNGEIILTSHQFGVNFDYESFPNDFIYIFSSEYVDSPLLQMSVIRPDGIKLELLSMALPYTNSKTIHSERIFSTDNAINKNLLIGAQVGTTAYFSLEKDPAVRKKGYQMYGHAITDLINGKIDAVLGESTGTLFYKNQNKPLFEKIKMVDEILTNEHYAIAFRKDEPELLIQINAALKNILDDGTAAQLHKKWDLGLAAQIPK